MDKSNTELDIVSASIIEADNEAYFIDDGIRKDVSDKKKKGVNAFLGNLINLCDLVNNAKIVINPNIEYAVKFTPALLKKMQGHDVQFLKDKVTGDILPVLYDYTDKRFGGQVRLEMKRHLSNQDIFNLSSSISNLLEQQKIDALVEQVQQIHSTVICIKRGQDTDRFANVISGRNTLLQALSIENDDDLRRKLIVEAISSLNKGKEEIELALTDKLNSLKPVPSCEFKRLLCCFFKPEYYDTKKNDYDDIQEYFKYYCLSIEPLAYAYTCLQQPQMVERIVQSCGKIFSNENLVSLTSIEPILNEGEYNKTQFQLAWYNNPQLQETKLLEAYQSYNDDNDVIIRVSGKEILEVMSNGKQEREEIQTQ